MEMKKDKGRRRRGKGNLSGKCGKGQSGKEGRGRKGKREQNGD